MSRPADMNALLNCHIKQVIADYPAVGRLLERFGVGCTTCNLGSCQMKDVVAIHNLDEAREAELLQGVAGIVFPGQAVAVPKLPRKAAARGGAGRLSPPVREMVEEHTWIKRVIARIPQLVAALPDAGPDESQKQVLRAVVDFVRNFADRYHHAKEEDLLFKYFDESSEILKSMHADHEAGRAHIRAVVSGIEAGDAGAIRQHLLAYGELLTEHIRKEDEILYPWMDRELTDTQVGQLFAQCREVDTRFGEGPTNHRRWVEVLEQSLSAEQETVKAS